MGISNWSGIVEEVRKLKLKDEEKISEELLKRVKKNDFVPKSKEGEYRKVLLEEAVETNGVSQIIGESTRGFGVLPPLLLLLAVTTMTVFLSEVTSNTAQVATMTPVLAAMGPALGMNPYMLVIVCALGASSAYMMPVGTPPNAIVFGNRTHPHTADDQGGLLAQHPGYRAHHPDGLALHPAADRRRALITFPAPPAAPSPASCRGR